MRIANISIFIEYFCRVFQESAKLMNKAGLHERPWFQNIKTWGDHLYCSWVALEETTDREDAGSQVTAMETVASGEEGKTAEPLIFLGPCLAAAAPTTAVYIVVTIKDQMLSILLSTGE